MTLAVACGVREGGADRLVQLDAASPLVDNGDQALLATRRLAAAGWKVKIREGERLEPQYVIIMQPPTVHSTGRSA